MDKHRFTENMRNIQDKIQRKKRELEELQRVAVLNDFRKHELQLMNHPNNHPSHLHGQVFPQQFIPEYVSPPHDEDLFEIGSPRRGALSQRCSTQGKQLVRETYDPVQTKPAMGMYENPFELSENSDNLTGLHCVMQRRIQDSISKNKRLRPTNLPIQRGRDLLNDENSNLYKKTEIKKEKLTISINTEDSTDISKSEHRNSVIKESSQSTNGINELIEEQAKLTEILKMEVQMSAIECGMDWSVIPQENVTVSLEENIHKQVQTLLVGQLQTTEPKICDKTTALDIVEVLVCENCNKPGHTKQYCHAKVCCKCKKEGHLSFNCPAAGKVCFKCNKGGHFSFNCPAAVKALPTPMPSVGQISAPTTTECTYCREKGHTSEDCPLTKYRRSTYTSLKHSLRACPKKSMYLMVITGTIIPHLMSQGLYFELCPCIFIEIHGITNKQFVTFEPLPYVPQSLVFCAIRKIMKVRQC